ncbi:hypothetical protein Tco_1308604, partial [Tanacetum coccineum]
FLALIRGSSYEVKVYIGNLQCVLRILHCEGVWKFLMPTDGRVYNGIIMGNECSLHLKVDWKLPPDTLNIRKALELNRGRCGSSSGRGGSMTGRGGGWLAKSSIVSNKGCGDGGFVVRGGRSSSESKNGWGVEMELGEEKSKVEELS